MGQLGAGACGAGGERVSGSRSRLRSLIDSLPEPSSWAFMVRFVVLQTGNYKSFAQACRWNTLNAVSAPRRPPGGSRRTSSSARASRKTTRSPRRGTRRPIVAVADGAHDELTTSEPQLWARSTLVFARTLGWARAAHLHHLIVTLFYLYQLIKYRILDLISHDSSLSDFHHLDCFILGRFRFVGRTNKIGGEIMSIFLGAFLAYRWAIHLQVPKFKFYALEFLMANRTEILANELRADGAGTLMARSGGLGAAHLPVPAPECQAAANRAGRNRPASTGGTVSRQADALRALASDQATAPAAASELRINSLYYLKSPFEPDDGQAHWVLRFNRNEGTWATLSLCSKLILYYAVCVLPLVCALMYYVLAGAVLTNLGFEMAYPSCVAWLRDIQAQGVTVAAGPGGPAPGPGRANASASPASAGKSLHFEIYRAPRVLAHEIPIDNIPARIPLDERDLAKANTYNIVRILFDLAENHLIYLEFLCQHVAQFFMITMSAVDTILNAKQIKLRLVRLLVRLHELRATREPGSLGSRARESSGRQGERKRDRDMKERNRARPAIVAHERAAGEHEARERHLQWAMPADLCEEIDNLQAVLSDHFGTLTHGYNLYYSYFVLLILVIWFGYTLAVIGWMSTVRSRALELEFVIVETVGLVFCLTVLTWCALVHSQNSQLYPLVARAMALDPDWLVTKQRWITILSYFTPKPLHCFTLFGSIEISWLLCLKLIFWIISAFVVLANFYFTGRS